MYAVLLTTNPLSIILHTDIKGKPHEPRSARPPGHIINCLVEGNSIRSTERMTGTHSDTICRLLVEVGDGCAALMDEQMRELALPPLAGR